MRPDELPEDSGYPEMSDQELSGEHEEIDLSSEDEEALEKAWQALEEESKIR